MKEHKKRERLAALTCLSRTRDVDRRRTTSREPAFDLFLEPADAGGIEAIAGRRTLDLALASRCREVDVIFMGGEPVLEMPLIRRAVSYLRGNNRPEVRIKPWIVTNGLLLDPDSIGFLVDSGFDIHMSFDGVPKAQDLRCGGSFGKLDRLLDRILKEHPEHCRDNLTVVYTLTPSNVESIDRSPPLSVAYSQSSSTSGIDRSGTVASVRIG